MKTHYLSEYRFDMSKSARDRADAGDQAANLNEQIAEGHEWAAEGEPGGKPDLHDDAASKYRRVAGKGRSKAESARDEADEGTD